MARAIASAGFDNIAGKYEGIVVSSGRTGLIIRRRPKYKRVMSPAQTLAAVRMQLASQTWNGMSRQQAVAWNEYADNLIRVSPASGKHYRGKGFNTFVALGTKILQVDPEAELPMLPPTSAYLGDGITLVARPVEGGIEFEASGPTEPDTVVELLAERLPNIRRAATGRLGSLGFVSFTPGNLTVFVPADPGAFVPGYQFVRQSTGQVAGYRVLDRLEVPAD